MGDVGKTLFENPLEDWPNDDLLLDDERRQYYRRHYGDLIFIFDWPGMRALFRRHELPANLSRKRIRSLGLVALFLGFTSLFVTTWTPALMLLAEVEGREAALVARDAGLMGALLAVISLVIGYSQLVHGRRRLLWLDSRIWTERIRQFHFQLILNNLPMIVAAVGNEEAKRRWRERRNRLLEKFALEIMVPTRQTRKRILDDDPEEDTWLCPEWDHAGAPPSEGETTDRLLDVLHKQRFGIQLRYTRAKTEPNLHSPATRKALVSGLSDAATIILLAVTIIVGVSYQLDPSPHRALVAVALGAVGTCSAIVVACRVLDEGLQLSADAIRYRWYLASLEAAEKRFLAGSTIDRVAALRELEVLSYKEMRQFLCAMNRSRFIF